MNALNSILIEGNVVRDPLIKETPRGSVVCNFSIASNRFYKQDDEMEQETSFFEVESWSKLAEACSKNCGKGRGVRVVGRLKQDRWTGTDGKNYSKVKVIAEHVEFKPQFKNRTIGESAADAAAGDAAVDTPAADNSPAGTVRAAGETLVDELSSIASSYAAEAEAVPVF